MNFVHNNWSKKEYSNLILYLKTLKDLNYKNFQSKLIPNIDEDKIIGVRTPILRRIAKEISKGNALGYLKVADSYYYEEIILQAIICGYIKINNSTELLDLLDFYSPKVDNWATCDLFCSSFKQVKNYRKEFLVKIEEYIKSHNPWCIRLSLVFLLSYYLDDEYIEKALNLSDCVNTDSYYVSMARAWLVATAFSKNQNITINFFKNVVLTLLHSIALFKKQKKVTK